MSVRRPRFLSSAAIVACCTLACASLSFLSSWGRDVLSQAGPTRLPDPPGEGVEMVGIETERFFEAVPVVRASHGTIYRYITASGEQTWEAGRPPGPTQDVVCRESHRQAVEEAAGALAGCREVQPPGE